LGLRLVCVRVLVRVRIRVRVSFLVMG